LPAPHTSPRRVVLARRQHPELLLYDYKLDALQVEKKLKFQELFLGGD